jgi:hypothetical protein
MRTKGTALVPVVLLAVGSGIVASLLAVWAVSELFGFAFDPSVVAVLSASVSTATIAAARFHQQGDRARKEATRP